MVLLTRYPFINLFNQLMERVAPEFFDGDGTAAALEAACADIDRWPEPVPGLSLSLPILGQTLQVGWSGCNDCSVQCSDWCLL